MKILVIAPTPFFSDRGCHVRIYEEIKSLKKLGHEFVLCTYKLGRDMPGINTVRTINMPGYKKVSAGPSIAKIFLLPFLTITTMRTIKKFQPDIIHAHLHEGAFIARVCKIFFRKKKYLFDMQGSLTGELLQHKFMKEGKFLHKFFSALERRIMKWFPIITSSADLINEASEMGADKDKMTNVMDGVDTSDFYPTEFDKELAKELNIDQNKPRVLYMGLLEKYQGTELMLKAFSIVTDKKPETQFIIIGYPNIEKYQAMSEELGISDKVLFLGRVAYTELRNYLSLSKIAIAPKIAVTEGDGKVYNYMSMEMVTIAFDRKVSREILGDTGIYAKFADAEDLARKIIEVMEAPKKWDEIGKQARKRVIEKYSWDAVGKRIDAVYQKLIST